MRTPAAVNWCAGGEIRRNARGFARVMINLDHLTYLSLLNHVGVLVGNSSSGIIESTSLEVPVVNVGIRQQGREHAPNVIMLPRSRKAIRKAAIAARYRRIPAGNPWLESPYGDGKASQIICKTLLKAPLGREAALQASLPVNMKVRIPLAKPEITDADRDAVLDVLRTPNLSMGPKLAEFEQAICDYTGCKYAVAVNSGTSALHLAVRALDLERGAEVILPSFTFSALLNVILQEGLRPRFVDIDPETYNITPETGRGRDDAADPADNRGTYFRVSVDVKSLVGVAQNRGHLRAGHRSTSLRAVPHHTVHVIEDACEALGRRSRWDKGRNFRRCRAVRVLSQ